MPFAFPPESVFVFAGILSYRLATRSGCVKAASYLSKTIPTEGRIGNIERKDG